MQFIETEDGTKKKFGWGGARPGQTGRPPLLTSDQKRAVGEACEARRRNSPKRHYRVRAAIVEDVAQWATARFGVTVVPRYVGRCWAEYRAKPKAAR